MRLLIVFILAVLFFGSFKDKPQKTEKEPVLQPVFRPILKPKPEVHRPTPIQDLLDKIRILQTSVEQLQDETEKLQFELKRRAQHPLSESRESIPASQVKSKPAAAKRAARDGNSSSGPVRAVLRRMFRR
tara:strand:- start:2178 stop:2567 length:390 start_codon:yes stop_codon:yes gene_type:complete